MNRSARRSSDAIVCSPRDRPRANARQLLGMPTGQLHDDERNDATIRAAEIKALRDGRAHQAGASPCAV
jgi:hypothetical protein